MTQPRVTKKKGTAYTEEYLRQLCRVAPHPCGYEHTGALATYKKINLRCECGQSFHRNIRQMKTMTGRCNNCNRDTKNTRRKNTCLEKYGVEHPSQRQCAKEKTTGYTTEVLVQLCEQAPQPCQYVSHIGEVAHLSEVELICACGNAFTRVARDMRTMTGKCDTCNRKDIVEKMSAKCQDEHGVNWYSQVPEVKAKRNHTNKERYGTEEYFASEDARQKKKITNLAKRGVEYPTQCPEVRAKRDATIKERYNVDNVSQAPEVRAKKKETMIKKYNVEHALQSKEIMDTMTAKHKHKYGVEWPSQRPQVKEKKENTNLERRGVKNQAQCPEVRAKIAKTNMERYGFENPMHCPEIVEKLHKKLWKLKEYRFPSGRVEYVQGYEPFCLDHLLSKGISEDDIVVGMVKVPRIAYKLGDKDRTYYPDIYIKSLCRLIEVKSEYTITLHEEEDQIKWAAASKQYSFEVRVYSKTGQILKYLLY